MPDYWRCLHYGDTVSKAKRYEYVEKDLTKAAYYQLAIDEGDRPESAVKDLTGVHQQMSHLMRSDTAGRPRLLRLPTPLAVPFAFNLIYPLIADVYWNDYLWR
jgi:hypothetical protein